MVTTVFAVGNLLVFGGLSPWPIERVNADRLHYAILHYMEHAAKHSSVVHRLVAQSGGWQTPDEAEQALHGQLSRHKQALEMRVAHCVNALGDGRRSDAPLTELSKTDAKKDMLCEQIEQADQEIRAATIKRRTVAQVQEAQRPSGVCGMCRPRMSGPTYRAVSCRRWKLQKKRA